MACSRFPFSSIPWVEPQHLVYQSFLLFFAQITIFELMFITQASFKALIVAKPMFIEIVAHFSSLPF
jgi:hypothetical protein